MRPWWLRVVEQTEPSYSSSREASLLETLLEVPNLTQVSLPRLQLLRQPHLLQGGRWGGTIPRQGAGRPCLQPGACWGPAPQA